jgi:hypothetical protein
MNERCDSHFPQILCTHDPASHVSTISTAKIGESLPMGHVFKRPQIRSSATRGGW